MKVNILIVGFQKCGTSALHSFLSKHPKVIGFNPKELDYFNYEVSFNKGIDYYHSFFNKKYLSSFRNITYLESSPSYLTSNDVKLTANRIKEYNKQIKIIALVRNPVDRAYSAWNMYRNRFMNGEQYWWFEWMEQRNGEKPVAIKRDDSEFEDFTLFLKNEIKAIEQNKNIECPVLSNGKYSNGIKIFKDVFKNNFSIFKNEDLDNLTGETLQKISDFLHLKNFDWSQFEGRKVFQGNYQVNIPKTATTLLQEYYLDSNRKLKELTGISY